MGCFVYTNEQEIERPGLFVETCLRHPPAAQAGVKREYLTAAPVARALMWDRESTRNTGQWLLTQSCARRKILIRIYEARGERAGCQHAYVVKTN
jgi:hypothetical protein